MKLKSINKELNNRLKESDHNLRTVSKVTNGLIHNNKDLQKEINGLKQVILL